MLAVKRSAVLPRRLRRPPRQAVRSLRPQDEIVPFDQLIEEFVSVEPYSNLDRLAHKLDPLATQAA